LPPLWRDGKNACSYEDHVQKKSRIANERDEEKRQVFRKALQAIQAINPQDLVFIDESGFSLSLYQPYGWALRSKRLLEAVPFKPFNRARTFRCLALWTWRECGARGTKKEP
jgi:hypothetical protein